MEREGKKEKEKRERSVRCSKKLDFMTTVLELHVCV